MDIFGDDKNDELDLDPEELTIGENPEDDFGEPEKQAAEPEPEPESEEEPEPEPDHDHLARQAQAQQSADAWAAEVERRNSAYAEAKAALAAVEKAYETDEATSEDKIAAIEKLTDARFDLRQAQATHKQASDYVQTVATSNPAKEAWTAANPRLASDAKFLADANAAYDAVRKTGMDERHPNFYKELDKRLKRTPPMNRQGRSSGAPVTAGVQRQGGDQPTLTEKDKAQIREWGLIKPGMPKEKRISIAKEYLRQRIISDNERRAG